MARVGLAFLTGAIGSLLGAVVAFQLATSFGGMLALPRDTAARVAGAITATYIGGSVNLFAVASIVGLRGATITGGASLLGALAAADVLLMAVYFSGLVAAHKAPLLRRIFPAKGHVSPPVASRAVGLDLGSAPTRETENAPLHRSWPKVFVMIALGTAICATGNGLSKMSPLPGTSTIATTLLTVMAARAASRFAPGFHKELVRIAPTISTLLLNAFFASIGATGRWAQVIGVAPAILVFSLVALAMHALVTFVGASILNRCCGTDIRLDDVIVASNANIGGPSTAATFAGLMGQDSLVVPAAVWGTVGYAVATTLGVATWKTLQ